MKKILITSLILLFIVPAWAFSAESELEKIPSPDQIKYFRVMKKEGGALFGIRLQKANPATVSANTTATAVRPEVVSTSDDGTLEKISGPWDLPLFQKIRQIGSALWGYRKDMGRHLGWTNTNSVVVSVELRTCLKAAISTQDTALKATIETARSRQLTAIENRETCQLTALENNEGVVIVKSFSECAATFQQAVKQDQEKTQNDRKSLQKTYTESLRTCYKSSTTLTNPVSTGNVLLEDLDDDLDL